MNARATPFSSAGTIRPRLAPARTRLLADCQGAESRCELNKAIAGVSAAVGAHVEPSRAAIAPLRTILDIGNLGGGFILAEIGRDMSRLPTQGYLISWVGLCPRHDAGTGKRRSNRMR